MKSATVEAMKKAALEAVRKAAAENADGYTPVWVDDEAEAPKPVAKKEPGFPDILKNEGKMYSEVFKDYWEEGMVDFAIPDSSEFEYPEWAKHYIPKPITYVAPCKLVHDAVLAYVVGSVTHLVGWPGTGKTNGLPPLIASRLGLPLLRLGLNKKGMMFDDLVGREAIMAEGGVSVTGHKDGVLIPWITMPSIVILDEFSRANMEITNGLMSLMERDGCLVVENRNPPIIKRNPACWLIAADNVKGLGDQADRMVGTELVDGAVLDRFEVTLEVDYISVAAATELVKDWFPGFPSNEAKKLSQFAESVQTGYKKGNLPLSFSPRALKEAARYTCIHKCPKVAIEKTYIAKLADEGDIEAARTMMSAVYGH